MKALYLSVLGFLALKLTGVAINLVAFPVLGSRSGRATRPASDAAAIASTAVSVLVPMRDETDSLRHTIPALLAQPFAELILLDDGSSDGSYELATDLTAHDPRVQVVRGTPAPPGWVGKTWACQQLGRLAHGSQLMFCDADVLLGEGAIAAILIERAVQQADLFSVFPRQVTVTLGEQLLVPLVDDVLLALLPFGLLSVDVPSAATANGSVLVFSRAIYDRVGGFASVRGHLVEDVALARRIRRLNLRLGLALGGRLVQTRMYSTYGEIVTGFSRGLRSLAGGSRVVLIAGAAVHLIVYSAPLVLTARHRRWAVPLALGMLERLLVELKTQRPSPWAALLTPLSAPAALPVIARALRREQTWKGRVYR